MKGILRIENYFLSHSIQSEQTPRKSISCITITLLSYQVKRTTPKLQISTFFVYAPRPPVNKTSGATYNGVPQRVRITESFCTNLLKPKSETFSKVSSSDVSRRTLSGLMSR